MYFGKLNLYLKVHHPLAINVDQLYAIFLPISTILIPSWQTVPYDSKFSSHLSYLLHYSGDQHYVRYCVLRRRVERVVNIRLFKINCGLSHITVYFLCVCHARFEVLWRYVPDRTILEPLLFIFHRSSLLKASNIPCIHIYR